MKKILLVMFIVLFTAASVFCGEFEETLKRAEQGDAVAQNEIGIMFSEGEDVVQDYEQAVYWFNKSAEQGKPKAQYNLGYIYSSGWGVAQDFKQAVYWYKKAAKQGLAEAQFNLAVMYAKGQGVTQDYKQAFSWYKKAADQGDIRAQASLGAMFFFGWGISQNYKQALYWYKMAADQGNVIAQNELGQIYENGQGVPQDYKQAADWFRKAAKQGHAGAQLSLGVRYANGQGVEQDYKQAFYWWKKSAEQGHAASQFNLGLLYVNGQGVHQDHKRAISWWQSAAEQGDTDALFNLGWLYAMGQGINQDFKQAVYWYTKAAELGHIDAQNDLGVMYFNGHGVPQNFKLAYIWLSLSAAQGNESAIKNRNQAAQKLTPQQLSEAQDLAAQIQYKIDNPVKPSPVASPTPTPKRRAPASTSVADVRWVQQTLKNLGYDPGPVDGVTGARTRSAIIAFQTDISVAPTGTIDEILFAQLRQMTKINQKSSSTKTDTGKIIGSGTGFFITRDGYILTCLHVVQDAARIEVYEGDKTYPASLIRSDPKNDLAILKINGSFQALAFSPHRSAKMGQDVFTVGYPNPGLQGVSAKYTKGTISSLTGFQDDLRLYQISIPIQPGNSGGALLDEHGNILGVVVAMLNAKKTFQITGSLPQNVNYAVKSLYAQAMIDTMPGVTGKLLAPSKTKVSAIDHAQQSTVMVVCYDSTGGD